ncbi:MAG: 2,3,4,5-tetrahydropyridine-2,6-dicarboxylate N-acetyltransferase, partial [Clostridia bacterium]|nr:2,3,4,5-tetrahydropyridine-2,6-dicarboxylate N-acetyltransferase [Clostridia bacterium]
MDAYEIIEAIRSATKKTPVKAYIKTKAPLAFENCHVFTGTDMVVIGDYKDIAPVLESNSEAIEDLVIENDRRNSALPLLDMKGVNARIEPGAIIRDRVEIGDSAVIMMGAIINIGAVVGAGTMIDM